MNYSENQMTRPYAWLALGAVLMYFSNWNWAVPLATWLFPVFLLRFSRISNKGTGLPALLLVCSIIGVASMWRLLDLEVIPSSFRVIAGLAVGIMIFLPFLVDRLLVPKLTGSVATLVFPLSWTALEYMKSLGNGSWGALAYTQYGNLPFMQLASITGIWGLSFLITWFGSVVNFAWEQKFARRKIQRIAIAYSLVILSVLSFGYGRLALSGAPAHTLSIASVTNPRDFVARFYLPAWTDRRHAYKAMLGDFAHFSRETGKAAEAEARAVFWQEYAVAVPAESEEEFVSALQQLAREKQIYLAAAIGLISVGHPSRPWQNKLVWVDPSGKVLCEYHKQKPAPPLEPIAPGQEAVPIVATPYGKIASIICADLDYPGLVRAGAYGADVLIIPAQDWPAADPLHTRMAVFRAIENGFSMVKGTGGGLSIAVDPYGRVINEMEYSATKGQMISRVPSQGVATIYSRAGDVFAWLCIAGLILLLAAGIFRGSSQ